MKTYSKSSNYRNNPGSIKRDLLNHIERESSMPDLYWVEIPIHNPETSRQKNHMVWMRCLLIHEVIIWLLTKTKLDFNLLTKFADGSGAQTQHEHVCSQLNIPTKKNSDHRHTRRWSAQSKKSIDGNHIMEFSFDSMG